MSLDWKNGHQCVTCTHYIVRSHITQQMDYEYVALSCLLAMENVAMHFVAMDCVAVDCGRVGF